MNLVIIYYVETHMQKWLNWEKIGFLQDGMVFVVHKIKGSPATSTAKSEYQSFWGLYSHIMRLSNFTHQNVEASGIDLLIMRTNLFKT